MYGKLLLLLFVATPCIQCHNEEIQVQEFAVGGIIDQAKELLAKLMKIVSDAIHTAIEKLKSMEEDFEKMAAKLTNDTETEISNKTGGFIDELNKIKKQADELGINIADCLKGREQDLINLPIKFGKSVAKCGTDKVAEGKAIIEDAESKVNATYITVVNLSKELNDCGAGFSSVICIGKVIGKMSFEIANLPVQITTNVMQAVKLFATLWVSMEKCAMDNALEMGVEGQKILAEISTCVKNKIPNAYIAA